MTTPKPGVQIIEHAAATPPDEAAARRLELEIGTPFAISHDCDLLDAEDQIPGCFASVECECGALWRADLLDEDEKPCPECGIVYTHVLLFCRADDSTMTQACVREILSGHGFTNPAEAGGADAADGDEDEDDEDDEDGDPEDDDAKVDAETDGGDGPT